MKFNKWTLGLAAAGLVTSPSLLLAADQQQQPNTVLTALTSTTLSGFVDTSVQWNPGTGNANSPQYLFGGAGKADGFNLNVVQVSLSKPLDESQWAAGYNVDLWFGPDANALGTQAGAAGDFAIRQAYVSLRTPIGNGLDWKIGVFDTIIGYESLSSVNNPNYTHSYGCSLEPTTHTGILASYRVNDMISFSGGVANTMGPKINGRAHSSIDFDGDGTVDYAGKAESYKTYMGSIALTAPDSWGWLSGSTLYGGVVSGFSGSTVDTDNDPTTPNDAVVGNMTSWYAGATMATPVTGLKIGTSFDYRDLHNTTADFADTTLRDTYAVGVYASLQATDKLSFNTRGEYYHGVHTVDVGPGIWATTVTVQYDLWKNVLSRLEFRWDHAEHGKAFGGTGREGDTLPIAATRANAFMLAGNFIYKF